MYRESFAKMDFFILEDEQSLFRITCGDDFENMIHFIFRFQVFSWNFPRKVSGIPSRKITSFLCEWFDLIGIWLHVRNFYRESHEMIA